jgi:hypothetical protein
VEDVVHVLVADASQVLDQFQRQELASGMFAPQSLFYRHDALLRSGEVVPTLWSASSCREL